MKENITQKGNKKTGIEGKVAQTFLIIFIIFTLALTLLPLIITLIMSVKNQQDIVSYPIWTFPKTGWQFRNYSSAFKVLSKQMLNTVIIDFLCTFLVLILSCYVAFLFVRKKFGGKNVLFFIIIAPMLVPGAVLLSSTYIVVAKWLNLESNWFGLILPYIAGNQIASIFMLKVFIGQHPPSLYEAGELDGANMVQEFIYICLPLAVPIMMVQGIGIFCAMYNDYLWPQLLFQTDLSKGVLMPYLKQVVYSFPQGVQYAMYLVAGIPLIISTIISMKFFISGDFAAGMKL